MSADSISREDREAIAAEASAKEELRQMVLHLVAKVDKIDRQLSERGGLAEGHVGLGNRVTRLEDESRAKNRVLWFLVAAVVTKFGYDLLAVWKAT
jgi:hypothetical protein